MSESLLDVRDLKVHFSKPSTSLFSAKSVERAVDGVTFHISRGEVLSLVGESGCGKTTVGRALTLLQKATSGSALFSGQDILQMSQHDFRPLRRNIQMIFQDPYASLNPRLTIEQTLREPLLIHGFAKSRTDARSLIVEMLERVGMEASVLARYPHEFSGGQRQRIGIARVMIVKPDLIIADEPVSALDVSIQAQVLNLLKHLQRESKVAMLFISHDLAVVRHISDRIAVMNEGRIVELAHKTTLFERPRHEYTQRLLNAIPRIPSLQGAC
ncbi:MAG: ATP-binding cassette domain-containing protein [Granulosicoccus sp.]